jgi:hypothetical protein
MPVTMMSMMVQGSITNWILRKGKESEDITNAYLVFPDIKIDLGDDEEPKAFAILLLNGMMIEWDGRVPIHCTSKLTIHPSTKNKIIGTFFGISKRKTNVAI